MKKLIYIFLLILLTFPTIVFAEEECNCNDIIIKNISIIDNSGYAEEVESASIDQNIIKLNLKMYNVGDSIQYNITIENSSNQDYYFTNNSIKMNKDYLEYSLINDSEVIKPSETKTIQLKILYKTIIPNDQYEVANKISITLSDKPIVNPETKARYAVIVIVLLFTTILLFSKKQNKQLTKMDLVLLFSIISMIPIGAYALCSVNLEIESKVEIINKEAIFDTGSNVNIKMKQLTGEVSPTTSTANNNILAIKYSETEPTSSNKEDKNIVSTPDSPYPIYMWFDNGILYWWSEDSHPNLNQDASLMFVKLYNLNNITGLQRFDTSNTTSIYGTFLEVLGIENVDPLASWNTSKMENMGGVFGMDDPTFRAGKRSSLSDISALKNWDTSNVTNMFGMFLNCSNLKSIEPIKHWNVSKVENISYMFTKNYELEVADLSNWYTPALTNMSCLFMMNNEQSKPYLDAKLRKIILSDKFITSKVTNMQAAFYSNTKLEDYDFLQYIDTSSATNIAQFFINNYNLTDLNLVKHFDTSKVTNMTAVFYGCKGLTSLSGIENWDVSNVDSFSSCFYGNTSLTDASAINNWNIKSTANFKNIFQNTPTHPEFTKVPGSWNSEGTFIPN